MSTIELSNYWEYKCRLLGYRTIGMFPIFKCSFSIIKINIIFQNIAYNLGLIYFRSNISSSYNLQVNFV